MTDSHDKELRQALAEFVGAFEVVFRYDWTYTIDNIGDEAPGATFLEPGLDDETEDWGARGRASRKIPTARCRDARARYRADFPFPLERLPDFKDRVW